MYNGRYTRLILLDVASVNTIACHNSCTCSNIPHKVNLLHALFQSAWLTDPKWKWHWMFLFGDEPEQCVCECVCCTRSPQERCDENGFDKVSAYYGCVSVGTSRNKISATLIICETKGEVTHMRRWTISKKEWVECTLIIPLALQNSILFVE